MHQDLAIKKKGSEDGCKVVSFFTENHRPGVKPGANARRSSTADIYTQDHSRSAKAE
jgi:hypothetical protein